MFTLLMIKSARRSPDVCKGFEDFIEERRPSAIFYDRKAPLKTAGTARTAGRSDCPGAKERQGFLLLLFRRPPPPLKKRLNPAQSIGAGYSVGQLLKAAHNGSQGQHSPTSASLGMPGDSLPDSPHNTSPNSAPNAPGSSCSSWGRTGPVPLN